MGTTMTMPHPLLHFTNLYHSISLSSRSPEEEQAKGTEEPKQQER